MRDEKKERYNLQEAAEIMAQGEVAGTSEVLFQNLKQSVRDGDLKAFQSGSKISYVLEEIKDVMVGGLTWVDKLNDERLREILYPVPDDLEAYWDDLNVWIEENESRISYQFLCPAVHVKKPHDITRERGCRRLILEHWPKIKSLYGERADARQVLRILDRNKSEYEQSPKLKTIQNKLINLRKEKLIP